MGNIILGNQDQGRTGEKMPKCFIVKIDRAFGIFIPLPGMVPLGFFITSTSQLGAFHTLLESVPLEMDIVVVSDAPDFKDHLLKITRRLLIFDALDDFEPGRPFAIPQEQMFATMAATTVLTMQEADEIRQQWPSKKG